MQTISLQSHVGADKVLRLSVPVDVQEGAVEVVVVVQPVGNGISNGSAQKQNAKSWPPHFFEETYGSLADDPIERPDQPPYEVREVIE